MGPMSRSRVVSLAALVAVILGSAVGLSHVGRADVVGACNDRTWNVIIGHAPDPPNVAAINTRVGHLVHADCFAAERDPTGGYKAIAQFASSGDAENYLERLVATGYTRLWHVQPVIEHR